MSFFEKYIENLNRGDVEGLAALFTEDVVFDDWGGRQVGAPKPVHAEGKEHYKKTMGKIFAGAIPSATLVKLGKYSMEYDVDLGGLVMPCVGCAGFDENGLVNEYIIRPR